MKTQTAPMAPAPIAGQLASPYNLSHPDSRCAARDGKRHRFTTTARGPVRAGRRSETVTCKHCGGFHVSEVDYGMLANLFNA